MRPVRPTPGTDNARLLDELIATHPAPVWNPNARLELMAHSRAADLRKLGWKVEHVERRRVGGGRKRDHGYRLLNPPGHFDAAGNPTLLPSTTEACAS